MERLHKNTQLMLEFLKGPLLILNFFYYTADTTPYCKYDQASDMWQQLELAFEVEYDLRDVVDCDKKWLVNFTAGKTQLVLF